MKHSREATPHLNLLSEEVNESQTEEEVDDAAYLSEDPLENLPLPPEIVDPALAEVVTWDTAPEDTGRRVPRITGEDEAEIPEVFVEEGLDEAEEELRALENEPESSEESQDSL